MNTRDLVYKVLFDDGYSSYLKLRELAEQKGIFLSSINELYFARGRGEVKADFTVPAVNLRGATYNTAKAMLGVAKELSGFWIFEIARSEMGYTEQMPMEYAAEILGAAIDAEWEGPIFLQGDHFQFKNLQDITRIKQLVDEAIPAGFYNIDIDGSTLVDLDKSSVEDQQKANIEVTSEMIKYIRENQEGINISIGGEIGHIGDKNSNSEDMRVFLEGLNTVIQGKHQLVSKVSVQTGTRHGGVVNSQGDTQEMKVDFGVIEECGKEARKIGVGGVVQHGASTLGDEQLGMFPKHDTLEIHLATGWQNILMDSIHFPAKLRDRMEEWVVSEYGEKYESREECIYRERKRAWGEFQKEVWEIDDEVIIKLMGEIKEKARVIQRQLGMEGKRELLKEYIK